MNDYHLDPPEAPEPPECCEDFMDAYEDGSFKCFTCGATIDPVPDPDPEWEKNVVYDPFPEEEGYPKENTCRHGNPHGDCDTCDHLGDLAYDEARERKFFGR
jgi:hypothetical protein